MDIRAEITSKIIAAIEEGIPPWRQGWSGGGLAYNAETQKPYQGANQLLLGIAGYSDPRWLTWRQAKKMGLHVRKGEHSTKIIRMVEVERMNADAQSDADVVGEEKDKLLIMRFYDVFNGSQIDGLEPLLTRKNTIQPLEAAEAMVEGMKLTGLKLMHGFNSASYSVQEDLIRMPDGGRFVDDESYWSVLLHECTHATGSHKRLQRLIPTARFGSQEYAKEELRAEVGW
jgi:antirestriction protein ArdC